MKANIYHQNTYRWTHEYTVDWLDTDDKTVTESHPFSTLVAALDWCRKQNIGWWRAVGFSDEWIPVSEMAEE